MPKTSLLAKDRQNEVIQAFALPETGSTTTLAVTTASGATAAFTAGMYRFVTDADCTLARGATATASDMTLVAGVPEYFYLVEGNTVAAITSTGTASLSITLC